MKQTHPMWTYLIGPLFSFLPQRWRKALPFYRFVKWERAAAIGGLAEFVLAFMALMHWFFHAMSAWVDRAVDAALNGKLGSAVTDQAIGGVVLFLWVVNPLTLLLVYFATEGIVRLWAGEMSETVLGTLPLFLVDKIFVTVFRIGIPENRNVADSSLHNPSLARILRERLLVARLPEVGDELRFKKSASEEILEIHSSRKKEGWSSPNVVCYRDTYYRLEADFLAGAPRPFHYVLRRLPMGVPSRKVLKYSPADAIVREQG
jgi:hypothetical protein